jgi:hypothetical protein
MFIFVVVAVSSFCNASRPEIINDSCKNDPISRALLVDQAYSIKLKAA